MIALRLDGFFPVTLLLLTLSVGPLSAEETRPTFRLGIIGLDTSHSLAFTKVFHDPEARGDLAGFRVVVAYPHGSADIESSASRIPAYTRQIRELGVDIAPSIESLLERVDGVLLETNDGRLHLEQARLVIRARKPVFVDKPVTASLTDAVTLYREAREAGVPIFSSSSLRYMASAQEVRQGSLGEVTGCDAFSPASIEKTHPDLFWYGIHGVEILFTVMGTGCESVRRIHTPGTDVVVGTWTGGRLGTFRGTRTGKGGYGGTAFGVKGQKTLGPFRGYRPLVIEIARFFRTGKAPVTARETLELYAFLEAADESKRRGGEEVKIEEVLRRAGWKGWTDG